MTGIAVPMGLGAIASADGGVLAPSGPTLVVHDKFDGVITTNTEGKSADTVDTTSGRWSVGGFAALISSRDHAVLDGAGATTNVGDNNYTLQNYDGGAMFRTVRAELSNTNAAGDIVIGVRGVDGGDDPSTSPLHQSIDDSSMVSVIITRNGAQNDLSVLGWFGTFSESHANEFPSADFTSGYATLIVEDDGTELTIYFEGQAGEAVTTTTLNTMTPPSGGWAGSGQQFYGYGSYSNPDTFHIRDFQIY